MLPRTHVWHLLACSSSRLRAPNPTAASSCFSTSPATNGTFPVPRRKTGSSCLRNDEFDRVTASGYQGSLARRATPSANPDATGRKVPE